MTKGIIEPDSEEGKKLGFTSDLFGCWLWKVDDTIWISLIHSVEPNKGNFSKLLKTIHDKGYNIKVPIPFERMRSILEKKGFKPILERHDKTDEVVNIWLLEKRKYE